ncbi:pirin family protein [Streptomyces sp. YS415]|uniref:pirin family protein n=1 Tax=Streptomyces sp. YS415 TaxID=2944806 RepID=UPI0020203CA4|nr:pirin family protein [Streptomyces sp. YS415]MCL7425427.1 pirin family protein [Streptomyces sp. YS415]
MSNLESAPAVHVRGGREEVSARPVHEVLQPRITPLGESTVVRRLLPNLGRRMVGAWCFVDHYGPDDITDEPGMWVPPHPHTGLQTVSWLHAGDVLHRDSVGSLQTIRARELGLMTAGRAIAHAEQSPRAHAPSLHGAQLWIALPDAHRHVSPAFEHHTDLPLITARAGLRGTVILGEVDGAASPGTTYSPLVGADLTLAEGSSVRLPLEPDFEYAVLTMSGSCRVDGVPLEPGSMLYLGCGRRELPLLASTDSGLLLLGGEPFDEKIIMWWNFIGRTAEEIVRARTDWNAGRGFGTVHGFDGTPTPAPELPLARLKPRGRVR